MRSPTKELPDLKLVWMTVSDLQAAVFLKLDTLSTGYIFIQWITQLVSIILIHWILIYLVYCALENLNNWGQNCNVNVADRRTRGLSSLIVSSVVTRERSVQILRQLCVRKAKKQNLRRQRTRTNWLPLLVYSWAYCYPPTPYYVWLVKQKRR